jgi:hypothetical protein
MKLTWRKFMVKIAFKGVYFISKGIQLWLRPHHLAN